jgi:hypothetical protein
MQSNEMNNMMLTVEAAWLCAAELDAEREEMERLEVLARRRRREIRSKYELESTSTQLDAELKRFQLDWRKKAAREDQARALQALPGASTHSLESRNQLASPPPPSIGAAAKAERETKALQKQKQVASIYARENMRLAALMRDKTLPERVKKYEHFCMRIWLVFACSLIVSGVRQKEAPTADSR